MREKPGISQVFSYSHVLNKKKQLHEDLKNVAKNLKFV